MRYANEFENPPDTALLVWMPPLQVIGAPLAAGLLYLDGRGGLRGWQWIFIGALQPLLLWQAFVLY